MPSRVGEFHEGELAIRAMLKVPGRENPTSPGLPMPYGRRVMESPLMAVGTLDDQGRPWTTVWGGERGFAQPVAQGVLGFNSGVDIANDPVYEALWSGAEHAKQGGVVQPNGGQGKMMSALAIDLESRDRVKLGGLMMAGSADVEQNTLQMAMLVTESLGNCPKYLNKKRVSRHSITSNSSGIVGEFAQVSRGLPLSTEALDLINRADIFFLSSTDGDSMDTNHRGGQPGFVRVLKNDADEVFLVYPEYSGNRLYQTLGNLKLNPLIGIVIPDFETSAVLYLTGSASILLGQEALSVMARTRLAVKVTVTDARFVKDSLPIRGDPLDYSPYNPPIRRLLSEAEPHTADSSAGKSGKITASLIKREEVTPTIDRFTFRLSSIDGDTEQLTWMAGQHLTFNFEAELDNGYAHMNEDDPQSLNEDYVRTFTISSPPVQRDCRSGGDVDVQITARKNGRATSFLWKHNVRVPLELPVMGFGGKNSFRIPLTSDTTRESRGSVFVAGGVGITPMLAQAEGVITSKVPVQVVWSLAREDVALAVDAFTRIEGLAAVTRLYLTGGGKDDLEPTDAAKLRGLKVKSVELRRVQGDDMKDFKGAGRKFYLCAGAKLLTSLRDWLDGEEVVWEDFAY